MFNSAFDGITGQPDDYWPHALRDAIEDVNKRIYDTFNNGVYRCGFATTQDAYDEPCAAVRYAGLAEERFGKTAYLMGDP